MKIKLYRLLLGCFILVCCTFGLLACQGNNIQNEKELLMFAVMRFGKSFTSLQCALHGNKSKVLVVCAKAEVQTEWKQNVQRPKCFKDYAFICDKDLKNYKTQDLHEADGWLLSLPQTGAMILTADCVPLYLWSSDGKYVSLTHCGWRGVVQELPKKAADLIKAKTNEKMDAVGEKKAIEAQAVVMLRKEI